MAMFDDCPDSLKDLEKMNTKLHRLIDSYTESVEFGYYGIENRYADADERMEELSEELECAENKLRAYEEEFRFMAEVLSKMDVKIPFSGHVIDFGRFLPVDDPRRESFVYEEEV